MTCVQIQIHGIVMATCQVTQWLTVCQPYDKLTGVTSYYLPFLFLLTTFQGRRLAKHADDEARLIILNVASG